MRGCRSETQSSSWRVDHLNETRGSNNNDRESQKHIINIPCHYCRFTGAKVNNWATNQWKKVRYIHKVRKENEQWWEREKRAPNFPNRPHNQTSLCRITIKASDLTQNHKSEEASRHNARHHQRGEWKDTSHRYSNQGFGYEEVEFCQSICGRLQQRIEKWKGYIRTSTKTNKSQEVSRHDAANHRSQSEGYVSIGVSTMGIGHRI